MKNGPKKTRKETVDKARTSMDINTTETSRTKVNITKRTIQSSKSKIRKVINLETKVTGVHRDTTTNTIKKITVNSRNKKGKNSIPLTLTKTNSSNRTDIKRVTTTMVAIKNNKSGIISKTIASNNMDTMISRITSKAKITRIKVTTHETMRTLTKVMKASTSINLHRSLNKTTIIQTLDSTISRVPCTVTLRRLRLKASQNTK
jgi:hypothetical protein